MIRFLGNPAFMSACFCFLFCILTAIIFNCIFNVFSDAFQEKQNFPSSSTPSTSRGEVDSTDLPSNELNAGNVQGADICGTGLKNEIGEYNCFLNVIIQVSA